MNVETALAERWLWLTGSLCIATIAIAIRWILERPRTATSDAKTRHTPILDTPWIVQPLRILYAVGIPAIALFWRGALTTSGLGLQPFFWADSAALDITQAGWDNWVRDIGWTCACACGVWLLVAIGDATAKRFSAHKPVTHHNLGRALREAVYHQAHWAFYREPFVLLWGVGPGAWAGLIPVVAEALVNPARWTDLQSPSRGRNLLIRAGLAVMSAVLYIQTQNIWPVLLADTLLVWFLGQTQENDG